MKLRITIDGKVYEADVEAVDEEEEEIPPPIRSTYPPPVAHMAGSVDGKNANACTSPVMGLVIKVNVKPGQTVESGELLLVLEAMKMETNVTAPRAARIKAVHVAPGDSVKMHQVLVEFA